MILGLLLILPVVFAASDFTVTDIKTQVFPEEIAEFTLVFDNPTGIIKEYNLNSPDKIRWEVYTDPRNDYLFKVYPHQSKTVTLLVKPLDVEPGQYAVRLDVRNTVTDVTTTEELIIDVLTDSIVNQSYTPQIRPKIEIAETFDPREDNTITLRLRNLFPIEMQGVVVSIASKDGLFSFEKVISLEPTELRYVEFTPDIDRFTSPRTDTIDANVKFITQEKTYTWNANPVNYEIISFSDIGETVEVEKSFLMRKETWIMRNDGNIEGEKTVPIPTGFIKRMFTKTEPELEVDKIDGKKAYIFSHALGPNESTEVLVTKNYRPFFYVVLLLVIIIIAYFAFRSPITISKSAMKLGKSDHGISELKMRIYIKNRGATPIENITLIDTVPKIAEIGKDIQIGTIAPNRISKRSDNKTYLTWNINVLDPFEERIITYKMTSKLRIIGSFRLPPALIKFKHSRTGKIKVRSNFVLVRE